MRLIARLRRLRRDRGGAALVEFTLVAPMLVGLMCGLAEFGNALRQYHIMEKGVRDASRYLAHASVDPPCVGNGGAAGGTASAGWTQAIAEAKNLAIYGNAAGSGSPLFKTWNNTATVSIASDPTCLANPRGVSASWLPQVTVTASAPYADLGMLSALGLGPITLTVAHQELKVS